MGKYFVNFVTNNLSFKTFIEFFSSYRVSINRFYMVTVAESNDFCCFECNQILIANN